jgi:hypothetical protein
MPINSNYEVISKAAREITKDFPQVACSELSSEHQTNNSKDLIDYKSLICQASDMISNDLPRKSFQETILESRQNNITQRER